ATNAGDSGLSRPLKPPMAATFCPAITAPAAEVEPETISGNRFVAPCAFAYASAAVVFPRSPKPRGPPAPKRGGGPPLPKRGGPPLPKAGGRPGKPKPPRPPLAASPETKLGPAPGKDRKSVV